MSKTRVAVAAVEGLFTLDRDEPRLIGGRVPGTDSYFFPRHLGGADPRSGPVELEEVLLSRQGRVWSYTTSNYQPPPPFVPASQPYEPITIAAVTLEAEQMVVLGQCTTGVTPDDLEVGMEMELTLETLYSDDDHDYLVWKWRPAHLDSAADSDSAADFSVSRSTSTPTTAAIVGSAAMPTPTTPTATTAAIVGSATTPTPTTPTATTAAIVGSAATLTAAMPTAMTAATVGSGTIPTAMTAATVGSATTPTATTATRVGLATTAET